MRRKLPVLFGCCVGAAFATSAWAQPGSSLVVTLEVVPGQNVTGNAVILVEAFIQNNGADFNIRGIQIDLPCSLPGKPGSSGTAMTVGATPLSVGNTSAAASGSVPWVYAPVAPNDGVTGCGGGGCAGGLRPIAQAFCRLSGSPGPGEPPYILPGGGARRYIGTWRYTLSQCAAGTFNIPYEVMNMPCLNTDLTRVVDENNQCAFTNFIAGAITVATGTCCNGTVCGCEGVNQVCCTSGTACPGFTSWNGSGTTCAAPGACACTSDADCPDNGFCQPRSCNLATGQCQNDTPPVCPGTTACANGVCDPAANGGAGGCIVSNKAAGTACGSNADTNCDNPDTCNGSGSCVSNNEPNGTACGSPADTDCDNPDTCVGGSCQSNNEPNGAGCTDDGNACTDDRCQGGACIHPNDDTNSCSDGINCTINDRCAAGACVANAKDCNDGLVCTLDSCDEATGDCVNTDINSIGCLSEADCPPGSPCTGGTCDCVENPDCTLEPRKDGNGANCHSAGEQVCVDMEFGGTPVSLQIGGGSFRVTYDPTCLDFQSAVPGDAPWTSEIFEQVDEVNGVIFYAVGSPVGGPGPKGSNLAGTMATFCFTKIGTCNDCDLCLTTVNPQHTRLTTTKGQEVLCAELGCSKSIFDDGELSCSCPGNINRNSDCNRTTAVVTWPPVVCTDECDGVLPKTCHCTATDGGLANCDYLANTGGTFPQGTYSFVCTSEDENCDEVETCMWTVRVSDEQTLNVHLQLSPVVENDEFDRCICFEMISSCSPLVMEEVCETITFGGPFQFPGQANTDVKVPKGKYVCVQARDRQHSLRSTHFPLTCDGVKYSVNFRGDPFFGGNWLIQGNLNRDPLVDILDFGTFLGQMNQNPTPPKDKSCDDNDGAGFTHADFNGDGVVDVQDYTFIQINFLANDKDDCCHDPSAGEPVGRTEVTVKELREMGLEDLAIADLNNDGVLNTDDMAAFVQGARPKAGKVNRAGAGRPSTTRGSK